MAPIKIYYFPLRGRVEVLKLMCAAKGEAFEMVDIDYQAMKTDRAAYPFGQCPRLVDGDVDICQSGAMIRHLARKFSLAGEGPAQLAAVDQLLEGVESIRLKYVALIYAAECSEAAKAAYKAAHIDPSSAGARNGGAHFAYLEGLLAANKGGSGYCIGDSLTAADLAVWEIVDLHLRPQLGLQDDMKAAYPLLVGLHARIAVLPGIAEYLASPLRLDKVNNNNLG